MCWPEHTDDTEAEQGVMTSHWADGFLFVGWLARDGVVVTVLTESAGKTKYGVAPAPVAQWLARSDCGSEGLGFESHQSHVGFFGPGRLLPRAGSAMGPSGKAGTTQPSFIHLTDASLRVLL